MTTECLTIELLSDSTFSRGEGTAGDVDIEIVHDERGLPYLHGRTIKGLLREGWITMASAFPSDEQFAATEVLGVEADFSLKGVGRLWVGNGQLPLVVREWVEYAVRRQNQPVSQEAVLRALTDVRRQTARDRRSGAPAEGTLRTSRVALRTLAFESPLEITGDFAPSHWRVLARACLAVRHAGLGRNRGRGHVRVRLLRALMMPGEWTDVTREAAELGEA